MNANAMTKKRKEQESAQTEEAKSEMEKKAKDSDIEMKHAEQDEGYRTQNTPAPPSEDGSHSNLSSAPDSIRSESDLIVVSCEV